MEFSLEIYGFLALIGFLAGWIDAIAGGGGLLVLPVLFSVGIPPDVALGTNKLQSAAGTFSASTYFYRKGWIDLKSLKVGILFGFLGALSGAAMIVYLETDFIKRIIPVLLILIALYFWFAPEPKETGGKQRLSLQKYLIFVPFVLAFYDGFFGPGTGSFLIFSMIFLLGFSLPKAVAHSKIFNFTSNLASIFYFGFAGKIFWTVGLVMIVGQLLGANLGAKMVVKNGSGIVRPLVVIFCVLMAMKLLTEVFDFSFLFVWQP